MDRLNSFKAKFFNENYDGKDFITIYGKYQSKSNDFFKRVIKIVLKQSKT